MKEERILLVEDDPEIAKIIGDHLRRAGYEMTWASTGQEGWEDFKKERYQLVLVDLMLPEMDGFTLCKNIRLKSDVPLLIVSARQEDEQKVKGLSLGADDYVTKPFSLSELTARIESHLRRYQRFQGLSVPSSVTLYTGDLQIDVTKRLVKIEEKVIPLTSKEYELLLLMADHPHRTFSKAELYEHIWDQADTEGNNTINVHVKSLRTKLGEKVKQPKWIETVWGTGYRFIGEQT
ncbi:response regulator transcription factor [Pontibacillus sp. ALD_SL1]|uniref:response regulator transcription factor n=1 Tax=Pontibacillus sp. ALD_SL1 TaxID=2777185 RepID=UPI001A96D195|nr:response regulator transcription factor [Pontibacillus sp. ALD_SL1]QST00895.1 response regulator transcription factor [Pontibacillus sp. ALD_SL1]